MSAKAEISRAGTTVTLAITCADEYAAMMLYDQINKTMTDGYLQLWLQTKPEKTANNDLR